MSSHFFLIAIFVKSYRIYFRNGISSIHSKLTKHFCWHYSVSRITPAVFVMRRCGSIPVSRHLVWCWWYSVMWQGVSVDDFLGACLWTKTGVCLGHQSRFLRLEGKEGDQGLARRTNIRLECCGISAAVAEWHTSPPSPAVFPAPSTHALWHRSRGLNRPDAYRPTSDVLNRIFLRILEVDYIFRCFSIPESRVRGQCVKDCDLSCWPLYAKMHNLNAASDVHERNIGISIPTISIFSANLRRKVKGLFSAAEDQSPVPSSICPWVIFNFH